MRESAHLAEWFNRKQAKPTRKAHKKTDLTKGRFDFF
jgi:hypothetical protein